MAAVAEKATTAFGRSRRRRFERWLPLVVATLLLLPVAAYAFRPILAQLRYRPQPGDIVFQPLPSGPLVNAIEGATRSPYSHCGIVAWENEQWVVYEAFDGVSRTPLQRWLRRGRGGAFAVYRLQEEHREHIPATLAAAKAQLGRKYDARYRLGGDEVYCSELIYLAYQKASGNSLGETVRLAELNWQPFQSLIEKLEGGPPPLDREIITPRDLATAPQLERVYRFGL